MQETSFNIFVWMKLNFHKIVCVSGEPKWNNMMHEKLIFDNPCSLWRSMPNKNKAITWSVNSNDEFFWGTNIWDFFHNFSYGHPWTIDFAYSFIWSFIDNSLNNYLILKLNYPTSCLITISYHYNYFIPFPYPLTSIWKCKLTYFFHIHNNYLNSN